MNATHYKNICRWLMFTYFHGWQSGQVSVFVLVRSEEMSPHRLVEKQRVVGEITAGFDPFLMCTWSFKALQPCDVIMLFCFSSLIVFHHMDDSSLLHIFSFSASWLYFDCGTSSLRSWTVIMRSGINRSNFYTICVKLLNLRRRRRCPKSSWT